MIGSNGNRELLSYNGTASVTKGALRLPALAVLVALAAAVTAQGAFYPSNQRLIALPLAIALLGAVLRFHSLVIPWSLLVTGGSLVAWALLLGDKLGDGAGIAYLVVAVVSVVMVVASMDHDERASLVGAVVVLGVIVALSGWWGVVFHITELALPGQGLWRASTTLTYSNAAAGLVGPIALITLSQTAAKIGRARMVSILGLVVLLVGLGATMSRAGIMAFSCGALFVLWRCGWRSVFSVMVPASIGAALALASLVPSFPETSPTRPMLPIAGLLLGIASTLFVAKWPISRLVAVVVAGMLLVAVALVGGLGGETPRQLIDSRLSLVSVDRGEMLSAAIKSIRENFWTGAGPSHGRLQYYQGNGKFVEARFVHNEYLQAGVELGLVGLLLLLSLLAAIFWGVRKEFGLLPLNLGTGVGAALIALGIQSGFDFLWHIPAIPLVAAVLIGVSWPKGSP